MKNLIENHVWSFALILTVVFSPVVIWGAWDTIDNAESIAIRIALCIGIIVVTYIGAGLLLMWNRWTQRKYREKGIIK
ncbi:MULTISPECIES: hypothetical protein [Trueperella]|uniref:Preprotein translocase subunit SecF n=1 Tax=Trueperella abortisuis TaxID=445930 RepID=A0ABT9PGZ7_9ACTO|nr:MULTISPECIES: hypothetical protein [Trueperella]MCI7306086.1 hypothetical protein [Trueperella sp.]MDP9831988.1 preprotein translocase subunit SecF [Trueperella abortisuis]MDY5403698.1 hypothetical protein [Trueperella sp.]